MNLVQQRRKRQKDKNSPSLCNFVRDNIAASREGVIGGKSGQKKACPAQIVRRKRQFGRRNVALVWLKESKHNV